MSRAVDLGSLAVGALLVLYGAHAALVLLAQGFALSLSLMLGGSP